MAVRRISCSNGENLNALRYSIYAVVRVMLSVNEHHAPHARKVNILGGGTCIGILSDKRKRSPQLIAK